MNGEITSIDRLPAVLKRRPVAPHTVVCAECGQPVHTRGWGAVIYCPACRRLVKNRRNRQRKQRRRDPMAGDRAAGDGIRRFDAPLPDWTRDDFRAAEPRDGGEAGGHQGADRTGRDGVSSRGSGAGGTLRNSHESRYRLRCWRVTWKRTWR